jgi:hypothetical protein
MKKTKLVKPLKLCEFCGKGLTKDDKIWKSSWGTLVCEDCVFYPLDVLKEVYEAKTLKEARGIIEQFDEGCENSFLNRE